MIWIIRCKNSNVTDFYLQIIKKAIINISYKVEIVDSIKIGKKSDFYIVSTVLDAIKLFLAGKRKLIVWFQGLEPEESYMRNQSKLRRYILERVERKVLKEAIFVIFISETMKRHFETKYKIKFNNANYIMPCSNTNICRKSFFDYSKYKSNVFTYVGSLSEWQGFEEIIDCYAGIEQIVNFQTKLLILTAETDKAQKILEKKLIKNFEVRYCKPESLSECLSNVKFGFILRDDTIVNRVATPTKISSYLSCGIIPIYSECLEDFDRIARDMHFKIVYDKNDFYENIEKFMSEDIDPYKIYEEYSTIFSTYYNTEFHISNLSNKLKKALIK